MPNEKEHPKFRSLFLHIQPMEIILYGFLCTSSWNGSNERGRDRQGEEWLEVGEGGIEKTNVNEL